MPDREKVFCAIRNCITKPKCRDCPWDECEKFDCKRVDVPVSLMLDVLKLLKEQEPKSQRYKEHDPFHLPYCPNEDCNAFMEAYWRFCPYCGAPMAWDEELDERERGR